MRNLTLWKKEEVTEGGCFRSRTSTGSFAVMHIKWSRQLGSSQHSESEQSAIPSENMRFKTKYCIQCRNLIAFKIKRIQNPTLIIINIIRAIGLQPNGTIFP